MAVIVAIIVVVILKYMGNENPTVIGGGVAGGVVGAISASILSKKK